MYLKTKSLFIRPYQTNDFRQIETLLKHPLVMKFSLKGPIEKEEVKKYIEAFFVAPLKKKKGLWPLILKDSGVIIGFAGLLEQTIDQKKETELGYRLAPEYWGKGYAREAGEVICKFASKNLKMDHLIVMIDPKNLPSKHLAKRLGFKFHRKYVYKSFDSDIYIKEFQ